MKTEILNLELNQTHVNNTNKAQVVVIKYLNSFGDYQERIELLKPKESFTRFQPLNRVRIVI